MNLSNEDWKYKIVNASPTRLVIVTYELILDRMQKAADSFNNSDFNEFQTHINNAKEFVTEMVCVLDMKQPVSKDLADLYFFTNKLLTKSYFSKDLSYLMEAKKIILALKTGLEKEANDSPCDSSQQADLSENYSGSLFTRPTK